MQSLAIVMRCRLSVVIISVKNIMHSGCMFSIQGVILIQVLSVVLMVRVTIVCVRMSSLIEKLESSSELLSILTQRLTLVSFGNGFVLCYLVVNRTDL